jgi:hypothetical protein
MRYARLLPLALLLALLAGTPAAQAPQPATLTAGSATIDEIKGEVTVQPPNAAAAAPQRGQVVIPESVIETKKGSVVLHLEDGSQVLVQKNSRVVLKAPQSSLGHFFDLLLGKILAKVQKRTNNAPSFKMGTPTAVITVRGTRFEVSVNKEQRTFVDVYEGLVEVMSTAAPSRPVLLGPGFHTQVKMNEGPVRPERDAGFSDDDRMGGRLGGVQSGDDRSERVGGSQQEGTQPGTQTQQPEQENEPPK